MAIFEGSLPAKFDSSSETYLTDKVKEFESDLRFESARIHKDVASTHDRNITITEIDSAYSYLRRFGVSRGQKPSKTRLLLVVVSYICAIAVGVSGNNLDDGFGWTLSFVSFALIGGAIAIYSVVGADNK